MEIANDVAAMASDDVVESFAWNQHIITSTTLELIVAVIAAEQVITLLSSKPGVVWCCVESWARLGGLTVTDWTGGLGASRALDSTLAEKLVSVV